MGYPLDTFSITEAPRQINCAETTAPRRSEFFLRKAVAACGLVAEKKIDYALLDNTIGLPGHLGALNDPAEIDGLATKIGREIGKGAEAYWREKYASPKAVERLIAEFRNHALIGTTKRLRRPALYRLLHPGENEVLGCPREWLDSYFAGGLSGLETLLLMDLRSRAGERGIFPSQRTIADDIGVSESSAQRALRSLRRRGEITAAVLPGRRHNHYFITRATGVKTTGLTSPSQVKTTDLRPYNQIQKENQTQRALSKTRGIVVPPSQPPARNFRLHRTPIPEIKCAPEEFERLRQSLFRFVVTDRNWNPTTPPEWIVGPPDDAITAKIAAAGDWNATEIITELRWLKESGKKPEVSYGFFEHMLRIRFEGRKRLRHPGHSETDCTALAGRTPATVERETKFSQKRIRRYIEDTAVALRDRGVAEFLPIVDSLERIAAELPELSVDLGVVEQQLEDLEQRLIAIARSRQSEQELLDTRRDLASHLRPWRGKMTIPQLALLESQFLDRAVLASGGLPRLSLFYLR